MTPRIQYKWSSKNTVSMEQRREELMALDIIENVELQEEWITLQHWRNQHLQSKIRDSSVKSVPQVTVRNTRTPHEVRAPPHRSQTETKIWQAKQKQREAEMKKKNLEEKILSDKKRFKAEQKRFEAEQKQLEADQAAIFEAEQKQREAEQKQREAEQEYEKLLLFQREQQEIFEGGSLGAQKYFEQKFSQIFSRKTLNSFLDSDGHLVLDKKCDTKEKQNAIARVIATNVKIDGFSGGL